MCVCVRVCVHVCACVYMCVHVFKAGKVVRGKAQK